MEATKLCRVCNVTKPLDQMQFGGKGYADGYKYLCKACKNKQHAASRKRAKERDIEMAELEAINLVEKIENGRTPARTFVYLDKPYMPEVSYQRNDGLKHIQSRGFRT